MNTKSLVTVVPVPSNSPHWLFTVRRIGLLGLIALSGCATSSPAYHSYVMQGQVLEVDGKTLTVCIGKRDGASVGQVLEVVRHVKQSSSPKAIGPNYRREAVGSARITNLFDEHYATADVLDGQPMVNDVAELKGR